MKTTVRLTESAVMLAAAFVLSLVPILNMPYGGSITLCSMLPICLIAYRHGTKWGLLVGLAGAILQLIQGVGNLQYATSPAAVVAIVMLDYIVAFACLGLSGVFRGIKVSQPISLGAGILLACAIRYLCHVISGCTVWAGVSIPEMQGLLYSLVYNAAYMVPETIVTLTAGIAVAMSLDLRSDRLKPAEKAKGHIGALIGMITTVIATGVGVIILFVGIQTEEGFDVTALSANEGIAAAVAAAIAVAALIFTMIKAKKSA